MKIRSITTHLLPPRWILVRVQTDDGIVGWGEAGVVTWPEAVRAALSEIADVLTDTDVGGIRDVWEVAAKGRAYRGGAALTSAVSAIDQALWDVTGRRHGVPVWQLLGGLVRDRVRAYSWLTLDEHGRETIEVGEIAELAVERVTQGFTAVKTGYPRSRNKALEPIETPQLVDDLVDQVAALRGAIGPTVDLALDLHGRFSTALAKRVMAKLEPFNLLFVEEPVVAPQIDGIRELARQTAVPLATGERLHGIGEFKALLDAGIGVLQPDLGNVGGITEGRRIANLARLYDVYISPHCSAGPVGLAANLQFSFATPNVLIQEQGVEYYENRAVFPYPYLDYIVDPTPFRLTAGHFTPCHEPGCGIEIDEGALAQLAQNDSGWRPEIQRRRDHSFAEW